MKLFRKRKRSYPNWFQINAEITEAEDQARQRALDRRDKTKTSKTTES